MFLEMSPCHWESALEPLSIDSEVGTCLSTGFYEVTLSPLSPSPEGGGWE